MAALTPEPNLGRRMERQGRAAGGHDERSNVRVAGSMDTTIGGPGEVHRCTGPWRRPFGGRARRNGQAIPCTSALPTQFPNFAPDTTEGRTAARSRGGVGGDRVRRAPGPRILQRRPQRTDRQQLRLPGDAVERCVLLLANDVRAEARSLDLVRVWSSATPAFLTTGNMGIGGQVVTAREGMLPVPNG